MRGFIACSTVATHDDLSETIKEIVGIFRKILQDDASSLAETAQQSQHGQRACHGITVAIDVGSNEEIILFPKETEDLFHFGGVHGRWALRRFRPDRRERDYGVRNGCDRSPQIPRET